MNKIFIKKSVEIVLVCLILLISLGLRFYKINNPIADWHSWRQADTASVARIFYSEGIDLLHPRYYDISSIQTGLDNPQGYRFVEFPIISAIHAVVVNILPLNFDTTGRLVSVAFSLVSTLLIYHVTKKAFGNPAALFSSLLFATIPYNIYFSRVVLPEPAIVTFGLLSIYLFQLYQESDKLIFFYLSATSLATTVLLKPYAIFYALPILYMAYKKDGPTRLFSQLKYLIFLNITLLPFLLWRTWTWEFIRGIPHWDWAFNGDGIRFRPSFFYWIFDQRIGSLILGTWGLILFGLGIITKKTNKGFILSFFLGGLGYLAIIATANVRHDYYQAIIIPVICIYSGLGASFLLEQKSFTSFVLLGTSLVFMHLFGWYQVREFYKINHPEIVQAGLAADNLLPKDAIVLAPYNGDTAFLYQVNRFGYPVNPSTIKEMIQKGVTHYISVNFTDPDTREVEENYIILEKTQSYIIADLRQAK